MNVPDAVAAVRAGEVVVLPTDTVYGLAATAFDPAGRDALYRLKGRVETQATALVAASIETLLEHVPELAGRSERILRALLPGPFTLVLPNPARRFAWLCGSTPEAIGVRVPTLTGEARDVLDAVAAVVATSANLPGGPESRRLDDVPRELRAGAAALVDGGELPGLPSTVLDLTGVEPRVLRTGAGDVATALDAIGAI
jgi:L-threonylcarbamoyladenylate synthase